MQLKKIDTESNGFRIARGAAGSAGAVGSMLCLDSVVMPFVYAVFPKHRLIRTVAFFGLIGLNDIIGLIGASGSKMAFDSYVDTWNELADGVNALISDEKSEVETPRSDEVTEVTTVKQYRGIDIPDENASVEDEKEFLDKVLCELRPFEFKNKEYAQAAVEQIANIIAQNGCENLGHALRSILGQKSLPEEVYDIAVKFGWDRVDAKKFAVEYVSDDVWVADLFMWHDISDWTYVVNPNFQKED